MKLKHYFKIIFYLIVFNGNCYIYAGSYDDFFAALQQDDAQQVQQLLQRGFDPNTPNPDGQHGLLIALKAKAYKAAGVLAVWPKTAVETRTKADESPLMLAALVGQLALCQTLIEHDGDVNKPGWAPLHYAATNAHLDVMQLLLEHNAYIDAASPNGTTPLMMAAQYGSASAVKLLLEAGADPTLKNILGLSALDFAKRGDRADSADILAAFVRGRQPKGTW
ncbi:MAG: ankyrin repeat domain-containing protein [Rhodoferax sp.]|nr:ankyrin repeat domain-containing protein [Rhodoferax sp.]